MMGAGSWLLLVCLEKLQEISGADDFFVGTQIATKIKKNRSEYERIPVKKKKRTLN